MNEYFHHKNPWNINFLHGFRDAADNEVDQFFEIFVVRIELHLVVVKVQIHLQYGQKLEVTLFEYINPSFDSAGQKLLDLEI